MSHAVKVVYDTLGLPLDTKPKVTATEGLVKLREVYPEGDILEIGPGPHNYHTKWFKHHGHDVTTVDIAHNPDIYGDYNEVELDNKYGCVWAAHVLEHQLNVNSFLKKIYNDLEDGGILAVTVPPRKDHLVGGHLTLWTPALLFYNLILAGFNCFDAKFLRYQYNMTAIVEKIPADLPKDLHFDKGDIEKLSHFFPFRAKQNINGFDFDRINW